MVRSSRTVTNPRVVLTGASGFIGCHLLASLAADRVPTLAIARRTPRVTSDVRWLETDLADRTVVARALAAFRPSLIFHLAGPSRDGEDAVDAAFASTAGLLETAAGLKRKPHFVLVSSSSVYGEPRKRRPITERAALAPVSFYGVAKVLQETLGMRVFRSGLPVVIARLFNVIGPGQHEDRVPAAFASQIARIERLAAPGVVRTRNLDAARDYVDVRDVIRALRVLGQWGKAGEIYNVCSGQAVRVRILLDAMVAAAKGAGLKVESTTDSDVMWQRGSTAKIRQLGWSVAIDPAQSARDVLDEWRSKHRVP